MLRPATTAFTVGIFMSASAEILAPETGLSDAIRIESGSNSMPVQEVIVQKIVPRLGHLGLQIASLNPNEEPGYTDLVVTNGNGCGTSFSFSRDKVGLPGVEVHFNLFGQTANLVDREVLHSSAMWNGTIGHGDEIARPTSFMSYDPKHVDEAVTYIAQNNTLVCGP